MRRHLILCLSLTVLAAGCTPNKSDAQPDDAKVAAKDDAKAPDAKADAKAPDAKADPKDDAAKEAERIAKIKERLAKLEESSKTEQARWNDELKASAKALVETEVTDTAAFLDAILASAHRRPGNADRDGARHPKETLAFFGIDPSMTVVEVGPGAGWYTEILAPMLASKGKLIVNSGDPNGPETESRIVYARRTRDFLASNADLYGKVAVVIPKEPGGFELGDADTADAVLVVRGLHGMVRRGELAASMKEMMRVLKPGGTLGVVQHRGTDGADAVKSAEQGYVPQAWLVAEIEKAGFKLVEASEINANPKDTHDHPEGVWNLPPTLTDGDKDKAKYEAIGESDRMTLKFQKPA